jgi:hypothetical protein
MLHDRYQPADWTDQYKRDELSLYIQGYVYMTSTFTNISYGDIFILSIPQMLISMSGAAFGAAIFIILSRRVAHQLYIQSSTNVEWERENVLLWLALREDQLLAGHIRPVFIDAMADFSEFHALSDIHKHFHGNQIFSSLPRALQQPLMSYVFEDFHRIFSDFFEILEPNCANWLTSVLVPICYPPKAIVLAPFEDTPGIIFLVNGTATLHTAENYFLTELEQTFIGESTLLGYQSKYKVTVSPDSNLCALLLPEAQLEHILATFPVSAARLRDLAQRRLEYLHNVIPTALHSLTAPFT